MNTKAHDQLSNRIEEALREKEIEYMIEHSEHDESWDEYVARMGL